MEKVTILGSSNAVAKSQQQNTHLLIETESRKIMIDCGTHPAASLGKAAVTINQITDLVLTHSHADHMGSLPLLIMDMWLEKRTTPLAIFGLESTLEKAKSLLELFAWQKWQNMFPVSFCEVGELGDAEMFMNDEVTISVLPVVHMVPNMGMRIKLKSGKVITYSSDTEPCENLHLLARDADVLLQEAAGLAKGHTSARQAGEIASNCGVKRLILIHYEARAGVKQLIREAKTSFKGKVEAAVDGMVL